MEIKQPQQNIINPPQLLPIQSTPISNETNEVRSDSIQTNQNIVMMSKKGSSINTFALYDLHVLPETQEVYQALLTQQAHFEKSGQINLKYLYPIGNQIIDLEDSDYSIPMKAAYINLISNYFRSGEIVLTEVPFDSPTIDTKENGTVTNLTGSPHLNQQSPALLFQLKNILTSVPSQDLWNALDKSLGSDKTQEIKQSIVSYASQMADTNMNHIYIANATIESLQGMHFKEKEQYNPDVIRLADLSHAIGELNTKIGTRNLTANLAFELFALGDKILRSEQLIEVDNPELAQDSAHKQALLQIKIDYLTTMNQIVNQLSPHDEYFNLGKSSVLRTNPNESLYPIYPDSLAQPVDVQLREQMAKILASAPIELVDHFDNDAVDRNGDKIFIPLLQTVLKHSNSEVMSSLSEAIVILAEPIIKAEKVYLSLKAEKEANSSSPINPNAPFHSEEFTKNTSHLAYFSSAIDVAFAKNYENQKEREAELLKLYDAMLSLPFKFLPVEQKLTGFVLGGDLKKASAQVDQELYSLPGKILQKASIERLNQLKTEQTESVNQIESLIAQLLDTDNFYIVREAIFGHATERLRR